MEFVNSSQDGRCVVYILWNKVIVAKICYCMATSRTSIFVYADVIFSKCWSVIYVVVNSSLSVLFTMLLKGASSSLLFREKMNALEVEPNHLSLGTALLDSERRESSTKPCQAH